MQVLQQPSELVDKLLTKKHANVCKHSKFNVFKFVANKCLLFNTLTKELVLLDDIEAKAYNSLEFANTNSELFDFLVEHHFLVPTDIDETALYKQILQIRRRFYDISHNNKIVQYKIFTTTACNARCFYCFEEGMPTITMDMQTAENVVRYILKTCNKNSFVLYWFGGEPLCNTKVIDYICNRLIESGKEFRSKIITNGYLFDENTIRTAKNVWKLRFAQVTLDGTESEHNKRKNYVGNVSNPFQKTILNIKRLLDNDITVVCRLNFDERNLQSIYSLIDFLTDEFYGYEKFRVYPAILSDNWLNHSECRTLETSNILRTEYRKLVELLREKNLSSGKRLSKDLKPYYCMASNPAAVTIGANGDLYTCQSSNPDFCYGNIVDGDLDIKLRDSWIKCVDTFDKCKDCPYLPECSTLDKCPSNTAYCFEDKDYRNTIGIIKILKDNGLFSGVS